MAMVGSRLNFESVFPFYSDVILSMEDDLKAQAAEVSEGDGTTSDLTSPPQPPGAIEGVDLRATPGLNPGALS